jgi:hypothetical protein
MVVARLYSHTLVSRARGLITGKKGNFSNRTFYGPQEETGYLAIYKFEESRTTPLAHVQLNRARFYVFVKRCFRLWDNQQTEGRSDNLKLSPAAAHGLCILRSPSGSGDVRRIRSHRFPPRVGCVIARWESRRMAELARGTKTLIDKPP